MMRPDGFSTISVMSGESLSAELAHELMGIQVNSDTQAEIFFNEKYSSVYIKFLLCLQFFCFFNLLPIAVSDEFDCVGMLQSVFLACRSSSIHMSHCAGGVGGSSR